MKKYANLKVKKMENKKSQKKKSIFLNFIVVFLSFVICFLSKNKGWQILQKRLLKIHLIFYKIILNICKNILKQRLIIQMNTKSK